MDLEALFTILSYTSAFFVSVPIIFLFFFYRYFNKITKLLLIYLLLSLLTEIIQLIFIKCGKESIYITNIFSLLEFLLIALMYHLALELKKIKKFVFFGLILLIVLLFLIRFQNGPMPVFNSFYISLIVLFSLYYFYRENRDMKIENLTSHYFFWINSAFLFYFGFSFFIFISDDFIVSAPRNIARVLWTFHLIVNIAYYSILSIGIWKTSGKRL